MKTTTKTIALLLLISATLHSCSKDDSPPEPTVAELLTSGKWYLEAYSTNEGSIPPRTDCQKHSYLEFFPNGNRMSENFHSDDEDNCVTAFIVTGTWELIDDTQIYYSDDGVETFIEIISISETKLILSQSMGDLVYTLIFDKNPGHG
jgi:hypothetical protein